jgi:hypothetical protein
MRIFHVLSILSVLFRASASSLDSRAPVAHPLDARDTLDACAPIYEDLSTSKVLSGLYGISGVIGQFDVLSPDFKG